MNLDYVHAIRDCELQSIIDLIGRFGSSRRPLDVLDVGAGSGRQAMGLAACGHRVSAVDIETSAYAENMVFPVTMYDGRRLPFPDGAFDVVVSSNVLEHVYDLDGLLAESKRVLRQGGIAVHVLPTPSWRFWTTLAHVPWLLKRSWQLATGARRRWPQAGGDSPAHARHRASASILLPRRHGERGNLLTETWYFSPGWWKRTFGRNGWTTAHDVPCGLFYTGTMLLAARMDLAMRQCLAHALGSSTWAYVLRPDRAGGAPVPHQSMDGI